MSDQLRGVIASVTRAASDSAAITKLLKRVETLDRSRAQNTAELGRIVRDLEQRINKAALPAAVEEQIRIWCSSFREEIQRAHVQTRQRFGVELEELLADRGWKLHGHMPDLKVAFYTVEVDDVKGEVQIWFGPKQERLATARLSPKEAAKRLGQIHKDIAERPLDEAHFIMQLHSAYEMVLTRRNLREGDRAPIIEVLAPLALLLQDRKFQADPRREYFRGYSRAQFAYDLHRLKQKRPFDKELALGTATRAFTGNRRDFIWVPSDQSGNGTVYSHVFFKPAGAKEG